MKYLTILFLLTGCNAIPEALQTAEDIIDDNAIDIKISREAIKKDTNVTICVQLSNVD